MFERAKALSVDLDRPEPVAVLRPVPVRPSVIRSNPFAKKSELFQVDLEQAAKLYRQIGQIFDEENAKKERKRKPKEAEISNIPKKLQVFTAKSQVVIQFINYTISYTF